LSVGGDAEKASQVASPVFMLPDGAEQIVFKAGGTTRTPSGLYLHLAESGHTICGATGDGKALRGSSLTELTCDGLSLHAGQGVFIELRSATEGADLRFLVDEIRIVDAASEDIEAALVIPDAKPKLESLGAPKQAAALGWLAPPPNCCEGERPSIVTYAGKDKLSYIDGAVMLGLSLQWHVPEFPRLCLVVKTMKRERKDLLTAAGWNLVDIDEWHPAKEPFGNGYWWYVYNKIDIFRVKVAKILWMDADMYVWDDSLREVLEATALDKGHIAMVKDCAAKNFNSGLMFFEPDLTVFKHLRSAMISNKGWDGLDQPLINKEYSGRIKELPGKFNTHGKTKSCKGVVAAHYTGKNKPTWADVHNLKLVSKGYQGVAFSLRCPKLYQEYFCAMKNARNYLSEELQHALQEAGNGQTCFS